MDPTETEYVTIPRRLAIRLEALNDADHAELLSLLYPDGMPFEYTTTGQYMLVSKHDAELITRTNPGAHLHEEIARIRGGFRHVALSNEIHDTRDLEAISPDIREKRDG